MRAAVAFLLPLLGQCRNFAGQDSLEAKRDVVIQQDAVSICYIYTTTYLQTVSIGGPTGPGGPSGLPSSATPPPYSTDTDTGTANPPPTTPVPTSEATLPTGPAVVPTTASTSSDPGFIILSITIPVSSSSLSSPILPEPTLLPNGTVVRKRVSQPGKALRKRASVQGSNKFTGFVSQGGANDDCSQALIFQLSAGELINVGASPFPLSVSPGTAYIRLDTTVVGSISADFQVVNGILVWKSPQFYNGGAVFCLLDNEVYAVFTSAGGPTGCVVINLAIIAANLCPTLPPPPPVSTSSSPPTSVVPPPISVPSSPVGSSSTLPASSTSTLPNPPTVTVTIVQGQPFSINLNQYLELLVDLALSFTTSPVVQWVGFGKGGLDHGLLVGTVPADWIPGDNVFVQLVVNSGVSIGQTYVLGIVLVVVPASGPPTSITSQPTFLTTPTPVSTTSQVPTSTGSGPDPVFTSFILTQGQTFTIDNSDLLDNVLDPFPAGFGTNPVDLIWIRLSGDHQFLEIDVPTDYPPGEVTIQEFGVSVDGQQYPINIRLTIVARSSSSVTPPPVSSATSSTAIPTSSAPSPTFTGVFNVNPGQDFSEDITDLVETQGGSGFSSLIFSVTLSVPWASLTLGPNGHWLLTGTVPVDAVPGTPLFISFPGQTAGGIIFGVNVEFVVSGSGPPESSSSTVGPSPVTQTTPSAPSTTSAAPTPIITVIYLVQGQSFNLDVTQIAFDLTSDLVFDLSANPAPGWLDITQGTVGGPLHYIISGTVPSDYPLGYITISMSGVKPGGSTNHYVIELVILPAGSPSTQSPVSSPTESPVSSPTESPVSSPTESPVSSPTESPVTSGVTSTSSSAPSASPSIIVIDITQGQDFVVNLAQYLRDIDDKLFDFIYQPSPLSWLFSEADATLQGFFGNVPSVVPIGTVISIIAQIEPSTGPSTPYYLYLNLVVIGPSSTPTSAQTSRQTPTSTNGVPTSSTTSAVVSPTSVPDCSPGTSPFIAVCLAVSGLPFSFSLAPYLNNPSDLLNLIVSTDPLSAWLSINGQGLLTGTAPPGFNGIVSLTIAVVPNLPALPYLVQVELIVGGGQPSSSVTPTLPSSPATTSATASSSSPSPSSGLIVVEELQGTTVTIPLASLLQDPNDLITDVTSLDPDLSGLSFDPLTQSLVGTLRRAGTFRLAVTLKSITGQVYTGVAVVIVTPVASSSTPSESSSPTLVPSTVTSAPSSSPSAAAFILYVVQGESLTTTLTPYLQLPTDGVVNFATSPNVDWVFDQFSPLPSPGQYLVTINVPNDYPPSTVAITFTGQTGAGPTLVSYPVTVSLVVLPAPAISSTGGPSGITSPPPTSVAPSTALPTTSLGPIVTTIIVTPGQTLATDLTTLTTQLGANVLGISLDPVLSWITSQGNLLNVVVPSDVSPQTILISVTFDSGPPLIIQLVVAPAPSSSTPTAPATSSFVPTIAPSTTAPSASPSPLTATIVLAQGQSFSTDLLPYSVFPANNLVTGVITNPLQGFITFNGNTLDIAVPSDQPLGTIPITVTFGNGPPATLELIIIPGPSSSASTPTLSSTTSAVPSQSPIATIIVAQGQILSTSLLPYLLDPSSIVTGISTNPLAAFITFSGNTLNIAVPSDQPLGTIPITVTVNNGPAVTIDLVIVPGPSSSASTATTGLATTTSTIPSQSPIATIVVAQGQILSTSLLPYLLDPSSIVTGISTDPFAAFITFSGNTLNIAVPSDQPLGTIPITVTINNGPAVTIDLVIVPGPSSSLSSLPATSPTTSSASASATAYPLVLIDVFAGQTLPLDLNPYLPSLTDTFDNVVSPGVIYTFNALDNTLSLKVPVDAPVGATFDVAVTFTTSGGIRYTLPFRLVVLPQLSSSASPLPTSTLPASSGSLTTPAPSATSSVAPLVTVFVYANQINPIDLLPFLSSALDTAVSIVSASPGVNWLSLNGQILTATVPFDEPAGSTVTVTLRIQSGTLFYELPIQIVVLAPSTTSSQVPSTSSAPTSSASPVVIAATVLIPQDQLSNIDLATYLQLPSDQVLGFVSSPLSWITLNGQALLANVPFSVPVGTTVEVSLNVQSGNQLYVLALQLVITAPTTTSTPTTAPTTTSAFTASTTAPTIITVIVNVPQNQLSNIDLSPYLQVPSDIVQGVVNSPVNWIALNGQALLANVPSSAAVGTAVDITLGVQSGGLTYYLQLQLVITAPASTTSQIDSSTTAPTTTSASTASTTSPVIAFATVFVNQNQFSSIDLSQYVLVPSDLVLSIVSENPPVGWIVLNGQLLSADVPSTAVAGSTVDLLLNVQSGSLFYTLALQVVVLAPTTSSTTPLTTSPPTTTSQGPGVYTTITTTYTTGSDFLTSTVVQPSGTVPGTVVVSSPFPTFVCDSAAYLIQTTNFFKIDFLTGGATLLNSSVGNGNGIVNAIGYNVYDNYVWGVTSVDGPSTRFVKISLLGSSVLGEYLNLSSAAAPLKIGEIDQFGVYWGAPTVSNSVLVYYQIDLNPNSPTYGQQLSTGTASLVGYGIFDWAFSPTTGSERALYAIGQDTATLTKAVLLRFDLLTFTFSVVQDFGHVTSAALSGFGAAYSDKSGYIYGSDNYSGQIWKFPLPGLGLPPDPILVSQGPVSNQNDGAHCFAANLT